MPMRLQQFLLLHTCLDLQIIDVLSHVHEQQVLILKFLDELVAECWLVFGSQEFLGEGEESCGIGLEVAQFEDSLWVW